MAHWPPHWRPAPAVWLTSPGQHCHCQALVQVIILIPDVCRFCVRGNHRGDISLTERSVSLLRRRAPGLTQLGDCFTWSLSGAGTAPRSALWLQPFQIWFKSLFLSLMSFLSHIFPLNNVNNTAGHWPIVSRLRLHIHIDRSWGPRAGSRGV